MEDINSATPGLQQVSPSIVERIPLTRKLARDLQLAQFAIIPLPELKHICEVHRVHPCPECSAPVALVAIEGRPGVRVVDAVPDTAWEHWSADILAEHDCNVFPIHGTDGLRHVLAVTEYAGNLFRSGALAKVTRASNCSICGALITCVRIGQGPARWYECESRWNGGWLLAHLSEPHLCFGRGRTGGEVTQ